MTYEEVQEAAYAIRALGKITNELDEFAVLEALRWCDLIEDLEAADIEAKLQVLRMS